MTKASHKWTHQKVIECLLIAAVLLGLVYLVHWVITEEPRPRYPGIEQLRGQWRPQPSGCGYTFSLVPNCTAVNTS